MRQPIPREPGARPPLRAIREPVPRTPVPRDDVRGVRRLPLPPDLKEAGVVAFVTMLRAELRAPLDSHAMALYNTIAANPSGGTIDEHSTTQTCDTRREVSTPAEPRQ